MRLWKLAFGALKDQNSILLASLARRTALRRPEIEAAVIKATTHDEYPIEQLYVDRVCDWIRLSPVAHLRIVVWAIATRLEKTRSWVVALKGLMLMHRILRLHVSSADGTGRFPFDLSGFTDGHSSPERMWAQNAFIRSYFAFLDQKSSTDKDARPCGARGAHGGLIRASESNYSPSPVSTASSSRETTSKKTHLSLHLSSFSISEDLAALESQQRLLDALLQVMPLSSELAALPLVVTAMEMVVFEVYDVYRRICSGVGKVLLRIYTAEKAEAMVALRVVKRATLQDGDLVAFFEHCTGLGLIHNLQCPKVNEIPEGDIQELEDIINGTASSNFSPSSNSSQNNSNTRRLAIMEASQGQRREEREEPAVEAKGGLQTVIITDRWETFDDKPILEPTPPSITTAHGCANSNFCDKQELPDLISF
ncbi:unnamed protein product [Cuscuta epithymum]|uniref:ENTH domain-containing protein n=1 Tax=Cuscuta epithymum TaxID=186058 RepID=A0AAV0FG91_9ASTE|nr:unnamed protein product [Cuscuta epithymum]